MRIRSASRALVLALVACGCTRNEPPVSTTSVTSFALSSEGIRWSPRVEVARGEAVRGPWQQNDSDYRWVDDPSVRIANDGDAIVAWVDQEQKDVFLGRWSREGVARLAEPVNVSKSPATFSWLPRIVEHYGDVHALWQEIVFSGGTHGGEIMFATSPDGGRTFHEPVNLSNSIAGDGKGRLDSKTWDNGSLDLAMGPAGEIYATWTTYEGALFLRRSDDDGATFAPALHVGGTPDAPARAPSLAVGKDGRVHLAWSIGESPDAGVRVAISYDRGASFDRPKIFGGRRGYCDTPSIAVDAAGRTHLVYVESAKGREGPRHVEYVRDGATPRRLSSDGASLARIAVDRERGVFVVLERTDVIHVMSSSNGGDSFVEQSVPGIAGKELGANASQQGKLLEKLAVARDGEVAVVNATFLEGRESHVWLVRGRPVY